MEHIEIICDVQALINNFDVTSNKYTRLLITIKIYIEI